MYVDVLVQSDDLHLGRWWSDSREVSARSQSGDVRYVYAGATQPGSRGPRI